MKRGGVKDTLVDFIEQYYKIQDPIHPFTCIREYKKPDTEILYDDRAIKGSIIVTKIIRPNHEPLCEFTYVSDQKVGKLGEPLIFEIDLSVITGVNNWSEQNTAWKQLVKANLRKKANKTGFLTLQNTLWGKDKDKFELLSERKVVHSDYDNSDMFLEVWKRGSGTKQKANKEIKSRINFTPILKPILQPQNI